MSAPDIKTICAFDIAESGAKPVSEPWPAPAPVEGARYRWLHFDLAEPQFASWAKSHLPKVAAAALVENETRPRCDRHGDGIILNLRGVNLNPGSNPEDMVSLRLWITPTTIVSARVRKVWALDAIREEAEDGSAPATVGAFLSALIYGLSKRIETVSLEIEDETDEIEESSLNSSSASVEEIGALRRTIIKMRRFVNPQKDAIDALISKESLFIDADTAAQIREAANRTRRTVEELDATRDRLVAIQDQLMGNRAHALGRNSYLLSVVAAIFLPLGFLTGLFGVNVAGMPGMDSPFAFWTLAIASVLVGVTCYIVFRLSKWL